ncbi:hypothetical protein RB195_024839 [Necator americanus]|uniref:Uncharacterized protein n=1 Tax=Necator americanus TaxID=51031 RepID=A0ABR1EPW6_NECAM
MGWMDGNAKMGPEQHSDLLGKWFYPTEQTSDNGNRRISSLHPRLRRHRRHQHTWQGTTSLTPEGPRKRKIPALELQLDYVLTKNIPLSDIRRSRAVWDVALDSDQRPVFLSFIVRFQRRYRGAQHQLKLDLAGPKDEECRKKFE